jgi:hypothetical protein
MLSDTFAAPQRILYTFSRIFLSRRRQQLYDTSSRQASFSFFLRCLYLSASVALLSKCPADCFWSQMGHVDVGAAKTTAAGRDSALSRTSFLVSSPAATRSILFLALAGECWSV